MFNFSDIKWRKDYEECGRDIYIHKIVRCTYDPKACPWMGRDERYYVVESKQPEKEYNKNGIIYLGHVDWVILKTFNTQQEAEQYIKWICLPDHENIYEMI